jgi:Predicted signal-transduction protein containing cAMP-binding and CBS domains
VVWGDEQGCEQLRQQLLKHVADNRIFQRMLADNALRQRPPVGRLREFVLTRQGNDKAATLDLKVQGLTPFVDGARLLALANGIGACNTLERLRRLVDKASSKRSTAPLMKRPTTSSSKPVCSNTSARRATTCRTPTASTLDSLNHLDRRILRESLRQAQRLQSSLALRYQL